MRVWMLLSMTKLQCTAASLPPAGGAVTFFCGVRAEATPNTEMILISDVNLNLLNELYTYGSVRNLKDRRNDLYEVRMKK